LRLGTNWGFSDPVVDRLLAHPKDLKRLLRRHRNAIFHYQESLLDPRFVELLAQGAVHVYWVRALQHEFTRFFSEYLSGLVVTDAQRSELQDQVESILHWYPHREAPQISSLDRTIREARAILAKYPDDPSAERQEIELTLASAEVTLINGRRSWPALRAQILREAGIE
jgi:hypothetical protein